MPGRLYAYAAAAVAFALLAWYAHGEHARAEEWHEKAVVAAAANTSNLDTITAQTKALDAWKTLAATPEDLSRIVSQTKAESLRVAQLLKDAKRAKEQDYALPECMALLRTSLMRTCPAISAGLRKLATSADGDGGSAGAGGEAVAGGAHR